MPCRDFNPRSPHGERQEARDVEEIDNIIFQSTLPARGATISQLVVLPVRYISIHAPRTGSDQEPTCYLAWAPSFQSTLPARGATRLQAVRGQAAVYFNPRSPHGERHVATGEDVEPEDFNPRSPHGERRGTNSTRLQSALFQSTLPARGATTPTARRGAAGCDFNPRSPHGERPTQACDTRNTIQFQSTLPARGATRWTVKNTRLEKFQSTLPARGATSASRYPSRERSFQSTLPARGATRALRLRMQPNGHFNPRSPHGERQRKVTILSIRIIGFAQKVYHKTVLLRISLAENAVILPKRPRNPVRTSLQKAGGLRFARAIRAARPYSISSPSGA